MSIKVAMIGHKGVPTKYGGVERHVEELGAALVAIGCEVVAYTRPHYTDPALRTHRGMALRSIPSLNTKHLDAGSHTFLALLHAMFVERGVDVIHVHGVGPSFLAWLPRVLTPWKRVVVTFHCRDAEHGKWGRFAKFMLRLGERAATTFAHQTITVSQGLRDYCMNVLGAPTVYVPNGVGERGITDEAPLSPVEFKRRFGLNPGNYFLVVSRLVSHKKVEDAIMAWQRAMPAVPLVIVGEGAHTDEYVASLKRLAGGNENVRFVGFRQGAELQSLMANAMTFVSASMAEGLPITVLEVMSLGVPVLLSDIPEHRELVAGGCGLLYPVHNVVALADAMRAALDPANASLYADVAARAKERVHSAYHWNDIALEVKRVYSHALGRDARFMALAARH